MNAYKKILFYLFIWGSFHASVAQKFISTESYVHFFSDAPLENIEAVNESARSAFDANTGDLVFSIPIDKFEFSNKLMEEHFNENYMETEKYPKATFQASIENWNKKNDFSEATAKGVLDLHGVKKEITVNGSLTYDAESMEINAKFPIRLADHKIKIPKAVFYNIAEEVDVTVKFKYEPHAQN